jgi:hypothetical protein
MLIRKMLQICWPKPNHGHVMGRIAQSVLLQLRCRVTDRNAQVQRLYRLRHRSFQPEFRQRNGQ